MVNQRRKTARDLKGSRKLLHLDLSAVLDDDSGRRFPRLRAKRLNLLHKLLTRKHLAEHRVASVKPRGLDSSDEKLRSVRVRASVGHRQQEWLFVLDLEVFVVEPAAVDRLATTSVSARKVTTLQHKVRNHTVESRAFVVEVFARRSLAFFASVQRAKVLCSLRHNVAEEAELDPSRVLAINRDVKESLDSHLRIRAKRHRQERREQNKCYLHLREC
mmetsp:Transcript_17104/g.25303  ORF Transcript_17104/g.25303 Transcript_17104/m.25303 type:complete len:217 (+) Transcript_17104:1-651(+)